MNFDPNASLPLRGASPLMRFIGVGLARLLEKQGMLEGVLDELQDRGIDMLGIVAGKLFSHWYGKTPQQVLDEGVSAEQFREIIIAHQKRGIAWHTDDDEPQPAMPAEAVKQSEAPSGPAFAGHPLSELLGKKDAELLAIEGISRAAIRKIREAEKAAASTTAA